MREAEEVKEWLKKAEEDFAGALQAALSYSYASFHFAPLEFKN